MRGSMVGLSTAHDSDLARMTLAEPPPACSIGTVLPRHRGAGAGAVIQL